MANTLVKSLSEAEQYVNTINLKLSCKVATTANITLSGNQTIDGISISANERVLVKDQSTGSENGIYICSSGSWSRSTDMNSNETCRPNSFIFIEEGSTNADRMFQLTTNSDIILGTTSLTFAEYGGGGGGVTSITSGDGINGTGTTGDITLSLDVDDTTIEINASGEASAKTALVTNGANTLATGDQIYDYVTGNAVLLTTNQTVAGSKTFSDSMIINDNLTINSSTTTINSDNLIVKDPLIKIADGNSTDNVDIGFYGEYNSKYSGLIRNSTDEEWYLFKDSTDNPPDPSNLEPANLNSNLDGGVVIKVTAKVNLVKGNCVYIHSDTNNDTTYVDKADASDTSKMPSFGLALKDINANNSGFVITLGNIINITTTDVVETGITLNDGDVCYISASESGKITNVPPSGESNRIQNIGKVIRLHNSNLTLRVGGAGRTNATSALNNGNIFMGDSNNNSVSKSFNTALTDENVVFTTSTQTLTNKTLTSASLNGDVSLGGHIIPTTDITYDLGSTSNRFRDLYLSGDTIHLGDNTDISINDDGDVEIMDNSNNPRKLMIEELIIGSDENRISLSKSSNNKLDIKQRGNYGRGDKSTNFNVLDIDNGGTGYSTYSAGDLLIGKSDGTLNKTKLTSGSNISITNGDGNITIYAKQKYNIQFSVKAYTRYTYWYYTNDTFGANYYYMNTTYSSTTLGYTSGGTLKWPTKKNLGMISPVTGNITSIRFCYCSEVYSARYEFAVLKGTYTSDSSTTTTLTQIGTTIIQNTIAGRYYNLSQTINSENNVNAGDQIIVAVRRSNYSSSSYYFLRMVYDIIIEE